MGIEPEVSPTSLLSSRQKYAVIVSASLVRRDTPRLTKDLRQALENAFTHVETVELILQSLLFDGYPCALEGLITLKNLHPEGLPAEEFIEPYSLENVNLWKKRGRALCKQIYSNHFDRLIENVADLSSTLKEWMLHEGYGRVLARPALSIDLRELGIIAILTVKELPRQLYSHLRGARNVGVTPSQLEEAIHVCAEYASPKRIQSALRVLEKLR